MEKLQVEVYKRVQEAITLRVGVPKGRACAKRAHTSRAYIIQNGVHSMIKQGVQT